MSKLQNWILFNAVCSILLTTAVEAIARERLLMDRGWRFTNGDPSDVCAALDYPEAADLTKVRLSDLQNQAKIAASQMMLQSPT